MKYKPNKVIKYTSNNITRIDQYNKNCIQSLTCMSLSGKNIPPTLIKYFFPRKCYKLPLSVKTLNNFLREIFSSQQLPKI